MLQAIEIVEQRLLESAITIRDRPDVRLANELEAKSRVLELERERLFEKSDTLSLNGRPATTVYSSRRVIIDVDAASPDKRPVSSFDVSQDLLTKRDSISSLD